MDEVSHSIFWISLASWFPVQLAVIDSALFYQRLVESNTPEENEGLSNILLWMPLAIYLPGHIVSKIRLLKSPKSLRVGRNIACSIVAEYLFQIPCGIIGFWLEDYQVLCMTLALCTYTAMSTTLAII